MPPQAPPYRANQGPAADAAAEARFQADLARLQKAKGWRSFMYSKTDPSARRRFFSTIAIMLVMALGGMKACARMQQQENHKIMLENLRTQQQNQDILLGHGSSYR